MLRKLFQTVVEKRDRQVLALAKLQFATPIHRWTKHTSDTCRLRKQMQGSSYRQCPPACTTMGRCLLPPGGVHSVASFVWLAPSTASKGKQQSLSYFKQEPIF